MRINGDFVWFCVFAAFVLLCIIVVLVVTITPY